MTFKDLRKIIDEQRKALERGESGLWPEPGNGNGNGHGYQHNKDYTDDDIDEITRQLALKYEGEELFLHAAEIVGADRLASWWYQKVKDEYIFHPSSYSSRGLNAYDGQGCYATGCVPECEFYPAEGKLYRHNIDR